MAKHDGPITSHHPAVLALLPLLGVDASRARGFTLTVEAGEVVSLEVRNLPAESQIVGLLPVIDRYELHARPAPKRPRLKLYDPGTTEDPWTQPVRGSITPEEIQARLAPYRVQVAMEEIEWLDPDPIPREVPASDWLDGLHSNR